MNASSGAALTTGTCLNTRSGTDYRYLFEYEPRYLFEYELWGCTDYEVFSTALKSPTGSSRPNTLVAEGRIH